jgi:hypothetical protein
MSAEWRGRIILLILALVAAFIVWNGVFDARIAEETRRFVRARNADPYPYPVRLDVPMHAAVVRSAWTATAAGAGAFGLTVGVGVWIGRKKKESRIQNPESRI